MGGTPFSNPSLTDKRRERLPGLIVSDKYAVHIDTFTSAKLKYFVQMLTNPRCCMTGRM